MRGQRARRPDVQPSEFGEQMRRLADAYGREVDERQVGTWFDTFARFDRGALAGAVGDYVRSQERFPTVAALLPLVQAHARRLAIQRNASDWRSAGVAASPTTAARHQALLAEYAAMKARGGSTVAERQMWMAEQLGVDSVDGFLRWAALPGNETAPISAYPGFAKTGEGF
jgi:hypothetical protein